jgi:hypothetical protein
MESKERKTKIELLKRKNRRSNFLKELQQVVNITDASFLEPEDNDEFCKDVFKKINSMNNRIRFGSDNLKKNMELSVSILLNIDNKEELLKKNIRILFYRQIEIEAVKIDGREIFGKLQYLLDKSRFSDIFVDFVIVSDDLSTGICIERNEYCCEYISWGI